MSTQCHTTMSGNCFQTTETIASFPVPRPAFRRLQYRKAGRTWYISSREHDIINKWQNEDATFCVLFNHLHIQRSVSMTVAPCQLDTCGMFPGTFTLLAVLRPIRPLSFRSFYRLSTLDVTHMRKCTRPSPLYRTASDEKMGVGLGTRLHTTNIDLNLA